MAIFVRRAKPTWVCDAHAVAIEGQVYGYFTMEHVAGGSLDRFWRSYGSQFIPVPVVVDVVKQVCRGLATASSEFTWHEAKQGRHLQRTRPRSEYRGRGLQAAHRERHRRGLDRWRPTFGGSG
jgi:serine/threonine protein kinase